MFDKSISFTIIILKIIFQIIYINSWYKSLTKENIFLQFKRVKIHRQYFYAWH